MSLCTSEAGLVFLPIFSQFVAATQAGFTKVYSFIISKKHDPQNKATLLLLYEGNLAGIAVRNTWIPGRRKFFSHIEISCAISSHSCWLRQARALMRPHDCGWRHYRKLDCTSTSFHRSSIVDWSCSFCCSPLAFKLRRELNLYHCVSEIRRLFFFHFPSSCPHFHIALTLSVCPMQSL